LLEVDTNLLPDSDLKSGKCHNDENDNKENLLLPDTLKKV